MPVRVLGPGVEAPVGDGYSPFYVSDEDRARVPRPDAVGRPLMEAHIVKVSVGALEDARTAALVLLVLHEQMDTLTLGEEPDDFGVEPGNGLELAGPVLRVVRPCQPCGLVRLPFSGHAVAELVGCLDHSSK